MTIKELIERLKLYDENIEVRLHQYAFTTGFQEDIDEIALEMSDREGETKKILLLG